MDASDMHLRRQRTPHPSGYGRGNQTERATPMDEQSEPRPANPAPQPASRQAPPAPMPPVQQQQYVPLPPPVQPAQRGSFKRGFGLGAGAGLGFGGAMLAVGLVGSLLSGMMMLGFSGAVAASTSGKQTHLTTLDTVWGKDTAASKIRAIPVTGPIMTAEGAGGGLALQTGTYGYEVAQVIDELEAKDADALVLVMDTPGGTVTGAKAISDSIDRYRARTGKKAFAFVQGMSASGGMYAMSGADEVISDYGTLIGHVGVIMGPFEHYTNVTSAGSLLTGTVTADKIDSGYITAGKGKDIGNPFREMTPEERAMLQANIDEEYAGFVRHVSTKRDIPEAKIVNELGAGIFAPAKAKEVGYIDDIMNRDEAMKHFATAAGLDPANTKVEQAGQPGLFESLMGAKARPWGVAPAAQPVGGQPARATASFCTNNRTPLAWHGDLAAVCG